MVSNELRKTATELNIIFNNTSKQIVDKIPINFRNLLEEIEDKDYVFEYDISKRLNDQNISDLTRGFISIIYKEYICSKEEKEKYLLKLQEDLINIEKEKEELYKIEDMFKNSNNVEKETPTNFNNITIMEQKKENLFIKLLNKIKTFLKFN